jgi:hypothetical protein
VYNQCVALSHECQQLQTKMPALTDLRRQRFLNATSSARQLMAGHTGAYCYSMREKKAKKQWAYTSLMTNPSRRSLR